MFLKGEAAFKKVFVFSFLWLELMQILLKRFHKTAYMEPITDIMVYLYGKGHFPMTVVFPCLAQCEYGQGVVIALLQVQMEACECCPWHHGNGKGVGRCVWLCVHIQYISVGFQIGFVSCKECGKVLAVLCPEVGEGFLFLMENGVAWLHVGIDAHISLFVKGCAELLVAVYVFGQEIQQGRIQGNACFLQNGDVQRNGHAVSAGNVLVVVEEIWLSVPCFHVNGCKCHCLCSFS